MDKKGDNQARRMLRLFSQNTVSRITLMLLALKLYLFWKGYIFLDVPANLLLLVLTYLKISERYKWLQFFRSVLVYTGAFYLAGCEIFPAPWAQATDFLARQDRPTWGFIWQFFEGYFRPTDLIWIGLGCMLLFMPTRRLKLGWTLAVIFLCSMGMPSNQEGLDLKARVDKYYAKQADIIIPFPARPSSDFDIVVLHTCSLGWDDLDYVKIDGDDFWRHFDYIFTEFNSVTSYSEDAGVRLLSCCGGQRRYADMPDNVPKDALLLERLRAIGYKTYAGYDLKDSSYSKILRDEGHADAPVSVNGLPYTYLFYDDNPLYDTGALLHKVDALRQSSSEKRAMLWFNFAALHAGVHRDDDKDWWDKADSQELQIKQEIENVTVFFKSVGHFIEELEKRGKPTLVIFVAEHGRGIRGTDLQPAELREIPTPQLTHVPLAIRWVGAHQPAPMQLVNSEKISHSAVGHLISKTLAKWPGSAAEVEAMQKDIPGTEYYTEVYNERMVMETPGGYTLLNPAELPVAGMRYQTKPVKYERTPRVIRFEKEFAERQRATGHVTAAP